MRKGEEIVSVLKYPPEHRNIYIVPRFLSIQKCILVWCEMSEKKSESSRSRKALTQIKDSPELEMRLFEILDQIRNKGVQAAEEEGREYRLHGLCAVLGYDPNKHEDYFGMPVGADVLKGRDVNIHLNSPEAPQVLEEAMQEDGAILIGPEGKILHSGRYINVKVGEIYAGSPEVTATYQRLKDTANAGTRHFSIIAASTELPGLLFYALKSDHPQIRVFKEGQVLYSTVPEEENYKPREASPYLKAA